MKCWNCGENLGLIGKLSFRAFCDACQTDLHCCRNCMYYKPGLPNECMVPNTDYVADRTANNFCEEFKLLGKAPEKRIDPKEVAKKLFGDETTDNKPIDSKTKFNNLFNDEP